MTGTCSTNRWAATAPSITVASTAAPARLAFGTRISTAPASSRIPVTYRNYGPTPIIAKSSTIAACPISFATDALTKTSARSTCTHPEQDVEHYCFSVFAWATS